MKAAADGLTEVLTAYGGIPIQALQLLPLVIATAFVFVILFLLAYNMNMKGNNVGIYMIVGIVGVLGTILVTVLLDKVDLGGSK